MDINNLLKSSESKVLEFKRDLSSPMGILHINEMEQAIIEVLKEADGLSTKELLPLSINLSV